MVWQANAYYFNAQANFDLLINQPGLHQHLERQLPLWEQISPALFQAQELLPPIGSQELWAAGVTYLRSRTARMEEAAIGGGGDFYDRVYAAARPELFFKANPYRVVGPGGGLRIRKDSHWNVPEPELTLFFNQLGEIAAYTIGNDMSSRSIEGENPLYLPQAKTYDQCAGLGPCLLVSTAPLPVQTQIGMQISRAGQIVFDAGIGIDQMKRGFEELGEWLHRECSFPQGCFLMTGTGIVPPNDFSLEPGDQIRIEVPPIGILENYIL